MKRLSEADTSKYFLKGKRHTEDSSHLKLNLLPTLTASTASRSVDSNPSNLFPSAVSSHASPAVVHKPSNMKKTNSFNHAPNSPTLQATSPDTSTTETTISSDEAADVEKEGSTLEEPVHHNALEFARSQANSSSMVHAVTSQVQEIERWLTKSNHGSLRFVDDLLDIPRLKCMIYLIFSVIRLSAKRM